MLCGRRVGRVTPAQRSLASEVATANLQATLGFTERLDFCSERCICLCFALDQTLECVRTRK